MQLESSYSSKDTEDIKYFLWWLGSERHKSKASELGVLILPAGNPYIDQVVVVTYPERRRTLFKTREIPCRVG